MQKFKGKAKRIMRRVGKSLLCCLVLSAMILTTMPTSALAYIGPIVPEEEPFETGTYKIGDTTYAYIQNEYIHFDVCVGGPGDSVGVKSHTVPTYTLDEKFSDIDKAGIQNLKLMHADPVEGKDPSEEQYVPGEFSQMAIDKVDYRFNVSDDWYDTSDKTNPYTITADFAIDYTFSEETDVKLTNYFTLVKTNAGSETADNMDLVLLDEDDTSINWGVKCKTVAISESGKGVFDNDDDMLSLADYIRLDIQYTNFLRTGHGNVLDDSLKDISVSAQKITNNKLSTVKITNGINETSSNSITEVYIDSYAYSSPFVAASNKYFYFDGYLQHFGVENHGEDYYSEKIEYNNNTLVTKGLELACYTASFLDDVENEDGSITKNVQSDFTVITESSALWGFRNLSSADEDDEIISKADEVTVSGTAQYLAVFPDGDNTDKDGKQIYKVIPAESEEAIKDLESKEDAKCVAKYRGNYNIDAANNAYVFSDGALAISPTITAVWDTVNSYVRLKKDGTLEFEQGKISLNSPAFKFYDPKDGGGLTFDGYDKDSGLILGIDPEKNNAYINIDLPGNAAQISCAKMDTKGNLVFSGNLKINLLLASMQLEKVGYGLDGKDFVCNGVHAKGKLKFPKAPNKKQEEGSEEESANILGFGGAKMEGEINTFDSAQTAFYFNFELKVKNLFEAAAVLRLDRLKNGGLCPEELSFKLNTKTGVDLAPAAPVVTLTGGGGGVSGLASTINGDYKSIPPVVLSLEAYGKIIKVVDGEVRAFIGPSQLRLQGTNVGILCGSKSLKIIDKLEAGLYLEGKEITYGTDTIPTKTYDGIRFGGDMGVGLKIFNIKNPEKGSVEESLAFFNNTISAEFGLGLESFVGQDVDKTGWTLVALSSYGKAEASLNVPAGVPVIGGYSFLGAGLEFNLGARTAFQAGTDNTVSDAFKNIRITGGVAAEGSILGIAHGRVIYIIPDQVKVQGTLFKDMEEIDWDSLINTTPTNKTSSGTMLLGSPEVIETDDGEEVVALTTANIKGLKTSNSFKKVVDDTYYNSVNVDSDMIADGENAILAVIPKDQENLEDIMDTVTCDKLSSLKWIPQEVDPTVSGYNAWKGTFTADEEGNVESEAIFLAIPKDELTDDNEVTISASKDFIIKGLATTPVTKLDSSISGSTLTTNVENIDNNKQYVLYTYLGNEVTDENGNKQITQEYSADMHEISSKSAVSCVDFDTLDNVAPTGSYYVTTSLVEKKMVTTTDEDGNEVESEVEIPVTSWVSTEKIDYENKIIPAAPATVSAVSLGNESLNVTWDKVDDCDGYKLTIYQEDEEGNWVDTERGFTFTEDQLLTSQGLSYDESTETYTADIAITSGGDGNASTISGDEDISITEEAAERIKALDPDKNYKVGVCSYRTNTSELDEEEYTYDEYSNEIQSEPVYVASYKEVDYNICLNGEKLSTDESGSYTAVINDRDYYELDLSDVSVGGEEVTSYIPSISVKGILDEDGNEIVTPIEDNGDGTFTIPEFEGTLSLEAKISYEHDGVYDDTVKYITINKDNTAPTITFDSPSYYASSGGKFTVSGMTEPGVDIELIQYNNVIDENSEDIEEELTADETGAFTYEGDLDTSSTAFISVRATDSTGNESEASVISVSKKKDISKAEVTGIEDKEYTGDAITQEFKVTLDGLELTDAAFDVTYADNTEIGTATVTITGKDFYEGSLTKTFEIKAAEVPESASPEVSESPTASAVEPATSTEPQTTASPATQTPTVEPSASAKVATKKANPYKLKFKKIKVKSSVLKKKKKKIKASKFVKVAKNGPGSKTFKKVKGNNKIVLSSTKKKIKFITLKKGLKKGKYTVNIKVITKATDVYKKTTKKYKIKVIVS
ncbi:MAG: hypothetical protein K6D02_08770 [Lachnospiraceae bacterium]|nr:hypothetical protein [Lachnospiraceae bacterium]